jgi:hypothetical protein
VTSLVDEFLKIAESRTKALLELDPADLDSNDPEHKILLDEKAQTLMRLKQGPVAKDEDEYRRRLNRQLIVEGLRTSAIIAAGTGLAFGATSLFAKSKKIKSYLSKHPNLAMGVGGTLVGTAILSSMAKRKEHERRLSRAHTILRPTK